MLSSVILTLLFDRKKNFISLNGLQCYGNIEYPWEINDIELIFVICCYRIGMLHSHCSLLVAFSGVQDFAFGQSMPIYSM